MKKTTGEKKIGFYLVMAAAVLSLVSMLIYRTVLSQLGLVLAGMKMTGAKELLNWAGPVNAVVTALTAIISCSIMLDAFGLVVSGLYQFSQIRSYVIYAAVVAIAMILNVAAGFTGIVEENEI